MADDTQPQTIPGDDATTMLTGYEYVVVGSGAGGGPLASRLARAGRKVLLLEAGDDQGNNINQQVPAFHARSSEDESMCWNYFVNHYADEAQAQKDSKVTWETPAGKFHVGPGAPDGSKMKGVLYPRAGTLGGCPAHHALITVYPHASDWDHIADLTGDTSWAAKNMRKYYERLESCEYMHRNTPGHGFTGWLGTDRAEVKPAFGDIKVLSILKGAARAMANSVIEDWEDLAGILWRDLNSREPQRDNTEAIYQLPLSMRGGRRSGVRDYVVETANAKNEDGSKKYPLDIRTGCLATRILFDRDQNPPTAVGVGFLDGKSLYRADPRSLASRGETGRVMASREVIVSAGAFNTPQLLKLSGLGPSNELNKFQVPLVVELPGVGQNLQDRYEIGVVSKLEGDFHVIEKCTFGKPGDPCLEEFHRGRGPYLSNGFIVGIVKKSSVADRDPDLFIFGGPSYFKGYFPGYSERTVADKEHFTWAVLKAHTRNSGGTVTLKSADPLDTPEINFNYFDAGTTKGDADKLDLAAITEGVQFARRIMDDVPAAIAGRVIEEVPGRSVASAEQIKNSIKNEAWGHHASCTCPMGPDGDPEAVLDSRFRVRGVKNLRVVDASVFPRIPGIFLILPIFMISEKAADVILEDARSALP